MRTRRLGSCRTVIFFILTSASFVLLVETHPYAQDKLHDTGYGYIQKKDCAEYCGADNQYCCSSGTSCYTSSGIALCSAAGGGMAVFTTTWTETETFTRTFTSYWSATPTSAGALCTPPAGSGEIACGYICCATWQYCVSKNQCQANGPEPTSAAAPSTVVYTTVTALGTTYTTHYSAPYRVTNGGATATASGTTTLTGTTTTGGQLSGGAIAGIVIGTLAGIFVFVLLCACCLVRGFWHGLLALLGLHSRKPSHKERSETIKGERFSRYSRYGGRPSSMAQRKEVKKEGINCGLTIVLTTLLALFGLRRDKKRGKTELRSRRGRRGERSDTSSAYYSDSYTAVFLSQAVEVATDARETRDAPGHWLVPRSGCRARHHDRPGIRQRGGRYAS